ncbi:Mitotic checkpoint serine/threonine-protein kinase BUB1, putative isoform 2 [Hibiscus syriacus]|uniref:Mitotic checkpoint serine/threonine-protein kinase BUB1, putative isoform 2 n=1 Tax=Hibiscus syriacus TaxID=106335 RepID=A0A6A2YMP2_HIBSY|nr:Mitotic checkpoint serine/threonine-protein kinase BUB1, putative isoform 2 [Hibiscus syriacus]
MLRSTSVDDHQLSESRETSSHGQWKLKHDNEEFRVMYREGPHGTPFHTLLVEGYVDGPLDVCLCISWESALYKKWWPQSSFPPLKVTNSTCVRKIRLGEQIALVRKGEGCMATISDVRNIDRATHGFTNDRIPEAKDVVRIDVVGGFALQKVNSGRSYFRTIANMDMKLDFVPPSLINFIARQLIGNGFKLYQKTVASVTNSEEDYSKALREPLFCPIREKLYSDNKSGKVLEAQELKSGPDILPNENVIEDLQDNTDDADPMMVHANDPAGESPLKKVNNRKRKAFGEIEEEENTEESTCLDEGITAANQPSTDKFAGSNGVSAKQKTPIRPEVDEALRTLEQAISIVRRYRFNNVRSRSSSFSDEGTPNIEDGDVKDTTYAAEDNVPLEAEVGPDAGSEMVGNPDMTLDDLKNSNDNNDTRSARSNSLPREVNHKKVAPASPQRNVIIPVETNQVGLNPHGNETFTTNGVGDVEKLSKWRKHRSIVLSTVEHEDN